MTVKRLRCGFDQHLSIGEQCHEGVSRFKSEGLSRTTIPCHFWRIDPREANRFSGVKNQRIAVNKFGDLTEPPFSLGNNLCRTEKKETQQRNPNGSLLFESVAPDNPGAGELKPNGRTFSGTCQRARRYRRSFADPYRTGGRLSRFPRAVPARVLNGSQNCCRRHRRL
jgi:hypothetical protein